MMAPEVKALLILAASELNANELRALSQRVAKEGPMWLTRQISSLREGRWHAEEQTSSSKLRSGFDQERIQEYGLLIEKVEDLLLKEAGMSKTAAIQNLLSSIRRDSSVSESQLPASTKIAFDIWLARLLDSVSPSLVLHHASKIRNEAVHGSTSRSSWPLSRADD